MYDYMSSDEPTNKSLITRFIIMNRTNNFFCKFTPKRSLYHVPKILKCITFDGEHFEPASDDYSMTPTKHEDYEIYRNSSESKDTSIQKLIEIAWQGIIKSECEIGNCNHSDESCTFYDMKLKLSNLVNMKNITLDIEYLLPYNIVSKYSIDNISTLLIGNISYLFDHCLSEFLHNSFENNHMLNHLVLCSCVLESLTKDNILIQDIVKNILGLLILII